MSVFVWARVRCPHSWLETNTPYYYSECVRVLGPVMEQGLEKTKAAAIFISEQTTQIILWVRENTPLFIEWVRMCAFYLNVTKNNYITSVSTSKWYQSSP